MDEERSDLEEGELKDDDSDGSYTPIERPANLTQVATTRFPPIIRYSDSEASSSDSSSSGSEQEKRAKRPKIRKVKSKVEGSTSKSQNNIWSTRLQEELLLTNLDRCGVSVDGSRGVESYDFHLAHKRFEEDATEKQGQKRTRSNRNDASLRKKKASDEGVPRTILDLTVNEDSPADEIARDIANKLCEEREDLILKVIEVLGKKKALEFFKLTQEVELDGGWMINNQSRRRTPGGVFLHVVRTNYHITGEQRKLIFHDERQRQRQELRDKQKAKNLKLKNQINSEKVKLLPELLTLADQKSNRERRTSLEVNVTNPPPTPETDPGHENSGDGLPDNPQNSYEVDFLDINTSHDMDLF